MGVVSKAFKLNLSEDEKYNYLNNLLNQKNENELVLYIHVPFCNKICSFCPFFQVPKLKKETYHEVLINQIDSIKNYPYFKKEIRGIYFGGGTPTALKPYQVDKILTKLRESFKFKNDIEISLESSVNELSSEMIDVFFYNFINRISIGIQSFDDKTRKIFNRVTDSKRAISKIRELKEKGFTNIGIDLLYNYPWQKDDMLEKDLKQIIELELAGVSIYSLNLFKKTPLYDKLNEDEINSFNDISKEEKNYNFIKNYLEKNGYEMNQMRKAIRNKLDNCIYLNNADDFGEVVALGVGAGGFIGNYQYYSYDPNMKVRNLNISPMGSILHDKARIYRSLISCMEKRIIDFSIYSEKLNMDIMSLLKDDLILLEKNNLIKMTKTGYIINDDYWFYSVSIITYLVLKLLNYDNDVLDKSILEMDLLN